MQTDPSTSHATRSEGTAEAPRGACGRLSYGLPEADYTSPDGSIVLFNCDCLDLLPKLPEGCVDAVVTDPPYGIGHKCNYHARGRGGLARCNDYPDVEGDDRPFDPSPLLGLGLPLILWGGNHYADSLPPSSGWLVWDKRRPDDLDQSTCELAWTNCVKGVRRLSHLWNGCMRASERGENYHPTQKPADLMEWCLSLRWTRVFGAILDPYMGSAPTGVACVKLGRSFIGVEKEPRYFEIAVNRIEKAFADQALFQPDPEPSP